MLPILLLASVPFGKPAEHPGHRSPLKVLSTGGILHLSVLLFG